MYSAMGSPFQGVLPQGIHGIRGGRDTGRRLITAYEL